MILKSVLAFIALIFLFGFLFGFSVLGILFKAIFGIRTTPRKPSSNQQKAKQTSKQSASQSSSKKIIPQGEGEYVDFEEIKE